MNVLPSCFFCLFNRFCTFVLQWLLFTQAARGANNLLRVKQLSMGQAGGLSRDDLLLMTVLYIYCQLMNTLLQNPNQTEKAFKAWWNGVNPPDPPRALLPGCIFFLTAKHFGLGAQGCHRCAWEPLPSAPPPKITTVFADTNAVISQTNGPSVGPPGYQADPSPSFP